MDTLTQALINAQKPRENAWQTAGQGMSQDTMSYLTNDRQFGDDDPTSRLVASLISGLGGAALQGFGAYQERERRNTLNQDLMSLGGAYYGGEDLSGYADKLQSSDARDLLPALQLEQASSQRELAQALMKEKAKRKNDFQYDMLGKGLVMGQDETGGLQFTSVPGYADAIRAQKGAEGGDIPEALRPTLAKVLADQPLTLDDANAITGAGRLDLMREARQGRQINEVGGRFDRSMGLREGEREIAADLEYITGMKPTGATASKEQARQASLNRLVGIFNQVAKDPNADLMSVVGNDAATQDALRQMAFGELRAMAGTGAALTGNEATLVSAQDFATLGTDPMGAIGRMVAGRDQKQFAGDMASILSKLEDARLMKTYGAKRVSKGFDQYDPEILRSIAPNVTDQYKSQVDQYLSGLGQQPIASGSPSPSPSIPAGMKLQRNPKTGATRLVPMN